MRFKELDWQQTPQGPISLRRRFDPCLQTEIYEVKLGDEYLMSSAFTEGEKALARIALHMLPATQGCDVVVGGLGLGYTTSAVLADPRVNEVITVETHQQVIGWHQRQLIPATTAVTSDPRSRLVHADFFTLATGSQGFDPLIPGRKADAILADIDHSPRHLLHPAHARLYKREGLRQAAAHLRPGGVFALWSNDPPDAEFEHALGEVFATTKTHVVTFHNPLQSRPASNTIYAATLGSPQVK